MSENVTTRISKVGPGDLPNGTKFGHFGHEGFPSETGVKSGVPPGGQHPKKKKKNSGWSESKLQ